MLDLQQIRATALAGLNLDSFRDGVDRLIYRSYVKDREYAKRYFGKFDYPVWAGNIWRLHVH